MTGHLRLRRLTGRILLIMFLTVVMSSAVSGRSSEHTRSDPGRTSAASLAYCIAKHDVGKLVFGVNNSGTIGVWCSLSGSQDCFTGEVIPHGEYPKGSGTMYLAGAALWVGAIVGRDTLVSVGAGVNLANGQFHPERSPLGAMRYRSTIDPTKPEFDGAISEQDYIAVCTDTFTSGVPGLDIDFLTGQSHIPLNVELTQRSFAWSYSYAEDFVLFDLVIKNIGQQRLKQLYLGLYVDCDVCESHLHAGGMQEDDICGFLHRVPAGYLPAECADEEDVNLAWVADNDGDFWLSQDLRVPDVTGMRVIRTPVDSVEISFNWWVANDPARDFGPQTRKKFRYLGHSGSGTPRGDRSKYHYLSNGEFDYDQIFTGSISPLDTVWAPPNEAIADDVADGYDIRYLLSCGPFDIDPGQSLPLSFAYVAGEGLHTVPDNGDNLPGNPWAFYENLQFSDLSKNAIWAEWIYDNPGIDTDGDGYAGVFYPCTLSGGDQPVIRQIARRGDGVPDFRGASPPPTPKLWVEPRVGAIRVRWNGLLSEITPDCFTGEVDFEGYRVYYGRDERRSSYSLVQSYDRENYQKWVWDDSVQIEGRLGGFVLNDRPFTLDELRCLYAPDGCEDTTWDPVDWSRTNQYVFSSDAGDSIFYFEPQGFNCCILGNYPNATTQICKSDISAIKPTAAWIEDTTLIPDSLRDRVLTEDGDFLYYEYEYTIDNLLPTVPYWINVTAFDYGAPHIGLSSLETSPTIRPAVSYAQESVESIMARDELRVYVYPNPYRMDGRYRSDGFEGHGPDERDRNDDRVRRIHFAGLPSKCTIRVFSIDGDLVRQVDHDIDPSDPLANHDTWDMITRNTQLAVSGIYYWVVETPDGRTQIGKLVIIM